MAAARTAVEAMDSTLDMDDSVLRLSAAAAVSPSEAAVLIARGRLPKEDTCALPARIRRLLPKQSRALGYALHRMRCADAQRRNYVLPQERTRGAGKMLCPAAAPKVVRTGMDWPGRTRGVTLLLLPLKRAWPI